MAALSITVGNVLAGADAPITLVTAGGTITAGMALYKDTATGTYKASDGAASGTAACDGISLNAATSGQPLAIVKPENGGTINLGATLAVGQFYCIADADADPGQIVPISDHTTGDYVVIIGVAISTSVLLMKLIDPNVAKA